MLLGAELTCAIRLQIHSVLVLLRRAYEVERSLQSLQLLRKGELVITSASACGIIQLQHTMQGTASAGLGTSLRECATLASACDFRAIYLMSWPFMRRNCSCEYLLACVALHTPACGQGGGHSCLANIEWLALDACCLSGAGQPIAPRTLDSAVNDLASRIAAHIAAK